MNLRTQTRLLFFLVSFFVFSGNIFALNVPPRPDGYITDKANLLSPSARLKYEKLLRAFEAKTTHQIVVATFPSLEQESLEDFSIRLAEKWKVGQAGKDNGVIFLIFKNERKMRIEVGYGLEGVLPDALAGSIITQIVAPLFKAGEYEKGINSGIVSIMQATRNELHLEPRDEDGLTASQRAEMILYQKRILGFVFFCVLIIFFVDIIRYGRYRQDHRLYKQCYSFSEWFFRFAILLAILSAIFRLLFYSVLFSRGGYSGNRGGSGGFSGGGGSFGGGGASGRW